MGDVGHVGGRLEGKIVRRNHELELPAHQRGIRTTEVVQRYYHNPPRQRLKAPHAAEDREGVGYKAGGGGIASDEMRGSTLSWSG